jgi:hypothetical protein
MKNLTFRPLGGMAVLFLIFSSSINAQTWLDFNNILNQLNITKQNEYLQNLQTLQNGNQGVYDFSGILDSLNNAVNGANPATNIQGQLPVDSLVRDSLLNLLAVSGFSSLDSLSIIGQFDSILAAWNTRQDSLFNIFDATQGQVNGNIGLPVDYTGTYKVWQTNLDSLFNNQDLGFQNIMEGGLGNFEAVFKEIFDANSFTRIEFNAGNQFAKTNYYGQKEELNAPVIGMRTVEQFDRTWEPRWRVSMSWFNNKGNTVNESVAQQNVDINPFIVNGSFDIMFNPTVINSGGNSLRFVTLLGMELGTYAPAHRNSAIPKSLENKGFTTGWGPVVGAGFSTRMGGNTVFALGSTAFGDVICNPGQEAVGYKYRSNRLESGVCFANMVTMRYEMAISTNWAKDGNKSVRFHQVTVGLPTTGLFK